MQKSEVKNYLIIAFVVLELLSMLFNFFLVKVNIGHYVYNFNFSVIFFCLGFFIVDIVADNYSPLEANRFIYYKFFSQLLFLMLGNIAIYVYGLEGTQLADTLQKSPWLIGTSLLATGFGFYIMSALMEKLKVHPFQGKSTFRRYLYSTIPGELLFSLIFTFACFSRFNSVHEMLEIFITSALAKIVLSFIFASIISIAVKVKTMISFKRSFIDVKIN